MTDAELIESLRLWNRDDAADRIEQLAVTNEALTAKLAQAEAGLREIVGECGCFIARTTLAEIKGETHE